MHILIVVVLKNKYQRFLASKIERKRQLEDIKEGSGL